MSEGVGWLLLRSEPWACTFPAGKVQGRKEHKGAMGMCIAASSEMTMRVFAISEGRTRTGTVNELMSTPILLLLASLHPCILEVFSRWKWAFWPAALVKDAKPGWGDMQHG